MDAGAATLAENFDVYGERLPDSIRGSAPIRIPKPRLCRVVRPAHRPVDGRARPWR